MATMQCHMGRGLLQTYACADCKEKQDLKSAFAAQTATVKYLVLVFLMLLGLDRNLHKGLRVDVTV